MLKTDIESVFESWEMIRKDKLDVGFHVFVLQWRPLSGEIVVRFQL